MTQRWTDRDDYESHLPRPVPGDDDVPEERDHPCAKCGCPAAPNDRLCPACDPS